MQICPVGALTGAAYRFRSRPFDLISTPGACEHCASGCALRVDHRRGSVLRRMAANDPAVNEEWNCDKGRWAFPWQSANDRISTPLVRENGTLRPASWPEALTVAATGLARARKQGVGVLVGGRATVEDAYAYSKFARVALGSNDIDFRARVQSAEEADFLGHAVAGTGLGVTYADLEAAPAVLLAGFEPEEESPIIFLRLRKAVLAKGAGPAVYSVAAWASRGLVKVSGRLVATVPGAEGLALDAITAAVGGGAEGADGGAEAAAGAALLAPGSVILLGERLAGSPGGFTAALRLASASGARLAWVPRRAGERGALEVGALPTVLPGGRPVAEAAARVDLAAAWDVDSLPAQPGKDTAAILAAAGSGGLGGLLVGGVDPADLSDPRSAVEALDQVGFLVSLEVRRSAVTERADVVLPVAPPAEKAGTYLDWEGRPRSFGVALASNAMSDFRVLDALAAELDVPLGLRTVARVRAEIDQVGRWQGVRAAAPSGAGWVPPVAPAGSAVLASWRMLLDAGSMQAGEPYLAGTAHRAVARLSAATAGELGLVDGRPVTVSTEQGSITVPLVVTAMPDRVVWLPQNSPACAVASLGVRVGELVTISGRQR